MTLRLGKGTLVFESADDPSAVRYVTVDLAGIVANSDDTELMDQDGRMVWRNGARLAVAEPSVVDSTPGPPPRP
jgi:hypothetical protein